MIALCNFVTELRFNSFDVSCKMGFISTKEDNTRRDPVFWSSGDEKIGAQETEVEEPVCGPSERLNRAEPIFCVEFEDFPEANLLKPINLRWLVKKYGPHRGVAQLISSSEAFVRQKIKPE